MRKTGEHIGVPQGNLAIALQANLSQDGQGRALVMLAVLLQLVRVEIQEGGPAEEENDQ